MEDRDSFQENWSESGEATLREVLRLLVGHLSLDRVIEIARQEMTHEVSNRGLKKATSSLVLEQSLRNYRRLETHTTTYDNVTVVYTLIQILHHHYPRSLNLAEVVAALHGRRRYRKVDYARTEDVLNMMVDEGWAERVAGGWRRVEAAYVEGQPNMMSRRQRLMAYAASAVGVLGRYLKAEEGADFHVVTWVGPLEEFRVLMDRMHQTAIRFFEEHASNTTEEYHGPIYRLYLLTRRDGKS